MNAEVGAVLAQHADRLAFTSILKAVKVANGEQAT
jgi:hypothetical protein